MTTQELIEKLFSAKYEEGIQTSSSSDNRVINYLSAYRKGYNDGLDFAIFQIAQLDAEWEEKWKNLK